MIASLSIPKCQATMSKSVMKYSFANSCQPVSHISAQTLASSGIHGNDLLIRSGIRLLERYRALARRRLS